MALALAGFGCATVVPVAPDSAGDAADTKPLPPGLPAAPDTRIRSGLPLVVVLSDPGNQHLEMLQVFSARLGRPYRIFNLADRDRDAVAAELASLVPIEAVALGPAAYSVADSIPGLDVFYAGVLDPGPAIQGVDALPPFAVQLDYWQRHAPDLRRLGVIGSSAMTARISALARACEERGIALEQRQVGSDTETLVGFRSMVPRIDGFVFLPDEAVLSPRVIREVISHGRQNDVQMLVYSPLMFNLGATLYMQPDPVQVARALIGLLENPDSHTRVAQMRTKSRLSGQRQLPVAEGDVDLVPVAVSVPSPVGY